MEYLIYGFGADIRQYTMKEILGWLLVVALLHLAAGNYAARRRVRSEYLVLVRQGRFSRWWRRLCLRGLCLCLGLTAAAFAVSLASRAARGLGLQDALGGAPLEAFLLFWLNLCFLSTFQLLLANLGQGGKLSFAAVAAVEVVSLYGGLIWGEGACWLPGSWKMYWRSSLHAGGGYQAAVVLAIQVIWVAACCLYGYKIVDGRK